MKILNEYYYLDVTLHLEQHEDIPVALYKKHIVEAIKQLFGEIGSASIIVDILKYYPEQLRAILRVSETNYVKLRASLTLCGRYENKQCSYNINKASPLLLALQGDSRDYKH